MVASSRSSLRRPPLRSGDHQTANADHSERETTSPKPAVHETSHAKRSRVPSAGGRESIRKRRKVIGNFGVDEIKIPLRSKEIVIPDAIAPAAAEVARSLLKFDVNPLHSPPIKAQYDEIKRIEEEARAAVGDGHNTTGKEDKRRLRSEHGGTRAKTELAQYFPLFDEMLSLEPPDPDVLSAKTRIVLIDDTPDFRSRPARSDPFGALKPLHQVEYLDLAAHLPSPKHAVHDPLGADVYYKAHRKAERHEKQMKNGDKEKAQHEKYQLERLLEELRGPDWLKALGISGITDTEKRRYEPKRALFIREIRALIGKFKRWKEEEKRRKTEKEMALHEEATEAEDDAHTEAGTTRSTSKRRARRVVNGQGVSKSRSVTPSEKGPDSSEIDALASQQLLQEAKSASVRRKKPPLLEAPLVAVPEVHKPFTSFFSKRHIRDAAVAGRQRGRTVLAFGEPVPELEDGEFELPEDILTQDTIRASQRNRRRARRSINE